jgi:CcmD family protein
MKTSMLILLLCLTLLPAASLQAQVARLVHYQGILQDSSGSRFDGVTDLIFSIYTSPKASSPGWTESHKNVAVRDGSYEVLLGSVNPLKLSFYEYYLEVRSSAGPGTQGRKVIVGSGYNFRMWFLFSAYSIIWLAIFAYLLSITRRQKEIITDLQLLAGETANK